MKFGFNWTINFRKRHLKIMGIYIHIPLGQDNQRTNGPVNAHLRSAVYMNVIENSPSIGAGEALGPLFFQNNQYTVHTKFSLQMTF